MRNRKAMACARVRAWVLVVAAAAVVLAASSARVCAQGEAQKGAPATVSGRVTDGKRGLSGVAVVLMLNNGAPWSADSVSAKTDAEGRYRVGNLAPGRYQIVPVAPSHVFAESEDTHGPQRGRSLLLGAGETVENVDFRLVKGGVLTGRVTGADGKPLIGEFVQVTVEDSFRPAHGYARPDRTEMTTDDRGVYRVYGLPAGSYRVSVGSDGPPRGGRAASVSGEKTYNQRTYYPNTTDAAQAKPVEVTEGGETTDIDISVAKTTRQTYTASGRIVFAETNQPAANVRVGYGPAGRSIGRFPINYSPPGGPGAIVADARGEFKLEGLVSGRYVAFAVREGSPDWYSEQAAFEITDADTEGVEVKLRRGASLSGVVQIEGVSDRAAASRLLSRARLYAVSEQPGGGPTPTPGIPANAVINADGTFRFGGLQPGRVRIGIGGDRESGVILLRVEHNGAAADRGIEIAEGAQVAGVRVVAGHGSAVIRGQINVTGGTLGADWSLRVIVRPVGQEGQAAVTGRTVEADSRGHFIIEGLMAGDYDVYAGAWPRGPGGPGGAGGGPGGASRGPQPRPRGNGLAGQRQRITVAQGGDYNITLALPLDENANQ